jgi:dephospho-CoA kinase
MPNVPPIVVGVAGRIGSGKSRVGRQLERDLGFQYFRYSLEIANWYGINPDDKVRLQEVGAEVMAGDGQFELNRRLIGHIDRDKDAVIDGLRHPTDHECLMAEFGARFALIFVETDPRVRFDRMRKQGRYKTEEEFRRADSQPTELNIDRLKPFASTTIAGTKQDDELISELTHLVDRLRRGKR